jgi:hypothetical protein
MGFDEWDGSVKNPENSIDPIRTKDYHY